jgi:hypothetical protein
VTTKTLQAILHEVPSEISRDEAIAAIRAAESMCHDWEAGSEHIHPYICFFQEKVTEGATNGWLREAVFGTGRKGGSHTDAEKTFLLNLHDSVTNKCVRTDFMKELVFAWGSTRRTIDSILLDSDGSRVCFDSKDEVVHEMKMAVEKCTRWHPESRELNPLVKLLAAKNKNNHSAAWLRDAVFGSGWITKHISAKEKCYLQTLYTTGNVKCVSKEFLKELSFAWGATVATLRKT